MSVSSKRFILDEDGGIAYPVHQVAWRPPAPEGEANQRSLGPLQEL
jgi:hypothetical protein